MAAILGSAAGIKVHNMVCYMQYYEQMGLFHQILLGAHVDTNIVNSQGATPLHFARNPAIINVCNQEHGTVKVMHLLYRTSKNSALLIVWHPLPND